ncbi:hypothetical protein LCGC14_0576900 [marine sediment metagenome]|uniref:Uncharacterized protein n=1 Tax=marine sediment metagenome TaxID=412755 RepID=A0A0F9UQS6_9ZZZZ
MDNDIMKSDGFDDNVMDAIYSLKTAINNVKNKNDLQAHIGACIMGLLRYCLDDKYSRGRLMSYVNKTLIDKDLIDGEYIEQEHGR